MARHKSQAKELQQPPLVGPNEAREIDRQAEQAVAAMDEDRAFAMERQENAAEIARTLGYDGALEPAAIDREIIIVRRRTVEDCLALGGLLLVRKELTPYGEWLPTLEKLIIAKRTAERFMGAALKISQNRHLAEVVSRGLDSYAKLLELLTMDDDEAGRLLDGESVRGVTLDDVDRMTASELRAALRQERLRSDEKDKDHESLSKLYRDARSQLTEYKVGSLKPKALDQQMASWPGTAGYLLGEIRRNLAQLSLLIETAEQLPIPDDDTPEADVHQRAMRLLYDALGQPLFDLKDEVIGVGNHLERIIGAFAYPDREPGNRGETIQ